MASARAVCLFVFFLHFCWAPCSSITRTPRRVSTVLKLSTNEGLVQQGTNDFGGRNSVDRLRVVKRDSSLLPDYDIRPLGDVQGVTENHSSISPLWVKGNVLLVLTQDDEGTRSSHLYRHYPDAHGAYSTANISQQIGSLWSTAESMKLSAADDSVVFIVSRDQWALLVSRDAGVSWEKQALLSSSFEIGYDLLFSPVRASDMVFFDSSARELYFSTTYGKRWTKLETGVNQMDWDADDSAKTLNYLFYTKDDSSHSAYSHTFHRVDAEFHTSSKTDDHVYKMVVDGRFVFTSKQNFTDKSNYTRRLYSSSDHGSSFRQGHIPAVSTAQSYVLIASHEAGAFIQYNGYGEKKGTLYASDSGGTFFSLSLKDHFYNVGHHDFYEVKSVRGVYITSVMVEDGLLESRITFDNGGVWHCLQSNWTPSSCEKCQLNLHLHSSVNALGQQGILMQGPLSHATAPGLIVATGMFQPIPSASASAINVTAISQETYLVVSSDGGQTWTVPEEFMKSQVSHGYFLFGVFDYGNAIAVFQSQKKYPIMWFSHDRGHSFQNNTVTSEPFIVRGFLPVPEAGDLIAAVFGQDDTTSPTWKVMFLDLTPFLQRPCTKADYTQWTPKGECVLGQNVTYNITKANSRCFNPKTYKPSIVKVVNCTCSYEVDFECVYGYERDNGTCVQSKNINSSLVRSHLCSMGQDSYDKSVQGYRKVPGDWCVGGDMDMLKTTKESCVAHEAETGYGYGSVTNVGLAVSSALLVVLVLVVSAAAIILVVYCSRRRRRSNEPVEYTRLPTSEPKSESTSDQEEEGQGEDKGGQKWASQQDEEMLNPIV